MFFNTILSNEELQYVRVWKGTIYQFWADRMIGIHLHRSNSSCYQKSFQLQDNRDYFRDFTHAKTFTLPMSYGLYQTNRGWTKKIWLFSLKLRNCNFCISSQLAEYVHRWGWGKNKSSKTARLKTQLLHRKAILDDRIWMLELGCHHILFLKKTFIPKLQQYGRLAWSTFSH